MVVSCSRAARSGVAGKFLALRRTAELSLVREDHGCVDPRLDELHEFADQFGSPDIREDRYELHAPLTEGMLSRVTVLTY